MHGSVTHDAALTDMLAAGLELRLHEEHEVGVGRRASGQRRRAECE